MKILITGAAGFIGSNVAVYLARFGHTITAVDSLDSLLYHREVKEVNFLRLSEFQNIETRIMNLSLDNYSFDYDFDILINFAALPGQILSWNNLQKYLDSNVMLVEKLIKSFKPAKIPNWIQASTSSVYGETVTKGKFGALNPSNPYGISKLAGEHLLQSYSDIYNFDFKILRFFSVYGPYQRPDMGIFKFFSNINSGMAVPIYGDGKQTRQLTFVDDISRLINIMIKKWDHGGQYYDVAGPEIISVNEIVDKCMKICGKRVDIDFIPRPIGDQLATKTTDTELFSDFGFNYNFGVDVGLKMQWDWMKNKIF